VRVKGNAKTQHREKWGIDYLREESVGAGMKKDAGGKHYDHRRTPIQAAIPKAIAKKGVHWGEVSAGIDLFERQEKNCVPWKEENEEKIAFQRREKSHTISPS